MSLNIDVEKIFRCAQNDSFK